MKKNVLIDLKEKRIIKSILFDLQRFDDPGDGGGGDVTPRSQEDILTALQGLDEGDSYIAGLNHILSEGSKTQGELTKLKSKITKLTKASEGITKERDSAVGNFNKLLDFNGIPVDTEDLDAALEELREQQKTKNKGEVDVALLQSKINDLMRKSKGIEKERDDNKSLADKRLSRIQSIIRDSSVENALKNSGALEYEALVPIFRDRVQILDDETPVYPLDDGSHVTVAEGVKMFFEKHPRLLANNQNPGAGSGGGAPGKVDFNKMSQKEYEKFRKEGKI
jgi:hypothetical protein